MDMAQSGPGQTGIPTKKGAVLPNGNTAPENRTGKCLLVLDNFLGVAGNHQLLVGSDDQGADLCAPGSDLAHVAHRMLVLLGVGNGDTEEDMKYIADKIIKLRIFSDENDKMNLSLEDVGGSMLVISQFTLYGDCSHGRRPYFGNAMEPVSANEMYEKFVAYIKEQGIHTETGEFGADMKVSLTNDGPVTIILESKN